MLNVTWVIDFGRSASPSSAVRVLGATSQTLRAAESRRQRSREMFAATRLLLAEARAVLATPPVEGSRAHGTVPVARHVGRSRGRGLEPDAPVISSPGAAP